MCHGYSQQEVAAQVGLHYSRVSRIVQRERKEARSKIRPQARALKNVDAQLDSLIKQAVPIKKAA